MRKLQRNWIWKFSRSYFK